jgi:hypothetical protein
MNASTPMHCPLCGCHNCAISRDGIRSSGSYDCKNCGKFAVTDQALTSAGDDAWKLASYVVDQNSRGDIPTFCSAQSSIRPESPPGTVGVDTVIASFPAGVAERLDRALVNLASVTRHLGQSIKIPTERTNPLLLAMNSSEVLFTIQHFESEGYIKGKTKSLPTEVSLTGKGLARVSDLQRGMLGSQNKQVFVAMSFDNSLTAAYTDGLKLGIGDCGYTALRVDGKEHNDKICDMIIAEIRNSRFLVADFTMHRNGVYFEAGLMMGLGRPVIFTCRNDELNQAHFDTRQYNHIGWDTPADLRDKLKRRIQATIMA